MFQDGILGVFNKDFLGHMSDAVFHVRTKIGAKMYPIAISDNFNIVCSNEFPCRISCSNAKKRTPRQYWINWYAKIITRNTGEKYATTPNKT